MTIKALADLIIYTGAVMSAMLGIGLVLRIVVVKPLKRYLTDELEDVKEKSDKVLKEVAPDGGLSLNERLARVEIGQQSLDQRMSDHINTHR